MKRKPCIYQNLAREMFLYGITITDLAAQTLIDYKLLCKKLNGASCFTLNEAIKIHQVIGESMPIEELFSTVIKREPRKKPVEKAGKKNEREKESEAPDMNKTELQEMIFTSPYTAQGHNNNRGGTPTRIQVDQKSKVSDAGLKAILPELRWTEARVLLYLLIKTFDTDRGLVYLDTYKEVSRQIGLKGGSMSTAIKNLEEKKILEKRTNGLYHLNVSDWAAKYAA